MAFAKIDTRILDSSLWVDRTIRDIFVTALLMALPYEVTEPTRQIKINSLENTDFVVPPGWYGFIPAASVGIIHRALVDQAEGEAALIALGEPDPDSRSQEFEGRRMVRVDGGFIVLNFMTYRDRDSTNAERQRRFRERNKAASKVSAEAQRVASELGLTAPRLSALIQQIINSSEKPASEIAQQLIKAYRAYLDVSAQGRLRYTWGPAKFFSEGHWASDASWPIIPGARAS